MYQIFNIKSTSHYLFFSQKFDVIHIFKKKFLCFLFLNKQVKVIIVSLKKNHFKVSVYFKIDKLARDNKKMRS